MSPGGLFAGESDRTVGTGPRSAADARRQPAGPPSNLPADGGSAHSLELQHRVLPRPPRLRGPRSPGRRRTPESSCYAPRPCHPERAWSGHGGRVAEPRTEARRAATEAVAVPAPARRTAVPRAVGGQLALELPLGPARARAGPGVEGPAAALGPEPPPDVLVPGELPGRPRPRVHRPLVAAGRRRARSVQRPWHDPAPGLRRGAHRRRQRPQPVRPPAHRLEGRPGRPGRERGPG